MADTAKDFKKDLTRFVAEGITTEAKLIAPVKTGRYRSSITPVETGDTHAVVTNVDYSVHIEARQGVFLRAIERFFKGS